jgi:hypothetical protein
MLKLDADEYLTGWYAWAASSGVPKLPRQLLWQGDVVH